MEEKCVLLNCQDRRKVTLCNHNFSKEGIYHPDRVMEEFDLLFMQQGEWTIFEEEQEYHLGPGSVLLLEPGKHHYSLEKCTPMMRNVYIHFEKKAGDQEFGGSGIKEENQKENSSILRVPKLSQTKNHKEIQHAFEKVIDAFWTQEQVNQELKCSLYLESLLLQMSELGRNVYQKTDILISEIIHRFHCEPDHFLSAQELAENYHVSVRTITGRFKEKTGMSLHQYQLQLKLDMAYDLLPVSKGRSLHDIALGFGFYDEFQFSKLFKRKFGISPSQRR